MLKLLLGSSSVIVPETLAVLLNGEGALISTATFRVISAKISPAFIPVWVQVTVPAVSLHAQPVPLAELKLKFESSTSVTVIVPGSAAVPRFSTLIV